MRFEIQMNKELRNKNVEMARCLCGDYRGYVMLNLKYARVAAAVTRNL